MARTPMWRRYARFLGADIRADLNDELRFHLDAKVEDLIAQGWNPEEARREAERQFGDLRQVIATGIRIGKERERRMRQRDYWGGWIQDARHILRGLRRDALFTALALAVLALGIGANTAVFSIVNSVLLRPLSYAHEARLVALEEIIPQLTYMAPVLPVNARHFLEWRQQAKTLEDCALLDASERNLTGAGEPERVMGSRVTTNLFGVLGVKAQAGRTFQEEDGEEKVALIGDSLWRRRFGASPSVVGSTIAIDSIPHTVAGILPPDYRDPFEPSVEIYVPWVPRDTNWAWAGDHNYSAVARLRREVAAPDAVAELNVIQEQIATRFESGVGHLDLAIRVTPLQDHMVSNSRIVLLTLMGAVAMVLLIACLNLGNLMFIRSLARTREVAVRRALGASAGRILRTNFLEGLMLSSAGAALGLFFAGALVRAFHAWQPPGLARVNEVSLDGTAFGFAVVLSVLSALLFTAMPALHHWRQDPQKGLRATGRSLTEGREGLRSREFLVGAEAGMSAALLIVAGLLVHSSLRLAGVERGYDATSVFTAGASLPNTRYPDAPERQRFWEQVVSALEEQPVVIAAGVVSKLPLKGEASTDVVSAEGDQRPIAERPILSYRAVSPGYFQAMGIPLVSGRIMHSADQPRQTAVLSARAAERTWPGQDPLGKRFRRGNPNESPYEVVGIVGDVRTQGLETEPSPIVYVPLWPRSPASVSFALRTRADPMQAARLLREAVAKVDTEVPLADIQTMASIESASTAKRRFLMNLVLAFAVAALGMAALGIYGVLAWSTGRRTGEIGIRLALGASAGEVRAMVLRQGMRPVLWGLIVGVAAAFGAGTLLSSLLFEVSAHDMPTYALVVAVTLITALAACWIPAHRASRIRPIEALRYE